MNQEVINLVSDDEQETTRPHLNSIDRYIISIDAGKVNLAWAVYDRRQCMVVEWDCWKSLISRNVTFDHLTNIRLS